MVPGPRCSRARRRQLAFRQTVHRFGVDLCWTPMILAKEFNRNAFARDSGPSAPSLVRGPESRGGRGGRHGMDSSADGDGARQT